MGLKVPNEGERQLLGMALESFDTSLRLFTNDVDPEAEDTTLATVVEMTGLGYVAKLLDKANWTIATDGSDNTTAQYPSQQFTFTAGATILVYGYYVTVNRAAQDYYLWGELLDAPFPANENNSLTVTPILGAD